MICVIHGVGISYETSTVSPDSVRNKTSMKKMYKVRFIEPPKMSTSVNLVRSKSILRGQEITMTNVKMKV
jgi:hypothetical protein